MLNGRLSSVVFAVGLVLVLHGCAETSTQRMINANDHNGLTTYYAQEVAVDCRGIAQDYNKAIDEADAAARHDS